MRLKGKLEFISLFDPIKLGEQDIREDIFMLFDRLNGSAASMVTGMNSIKICADAGSEYELKYERDEVKDTLLIILDKRNEFGMANLGAYLPDTLQRLNGMETIVTIEPSCVYIEHDETEVVNEMMYTHNNSCAIPDDKVLSVCKPGKEDCCIFMTVSPNGFECQKFDSYMSRLLLDRYGKGEMRANRIGNCKIVGRIKEEVS